MLEEIKEYLPFLIPLIILQLGFMAAALIHAVRHKEFKTLNKEAWILIILFVNLIGPALYFIIGKGDGENDYDEHS